MPLGSLSTLAVMKPGPSTARKSRIRVLQRFSMSARSQFAGFRAGGPGWAEERRKLSVGEET